MVHCSIMEVSEGVSGMLLIHIKLFGAAINFDWINDSRVNNGLVSQSHQLVYVSHPVS